MHELYLDRLVNHLREIEEYPQDIEFIIREGIWYKNKQQITMPDLIVACVDRRFLVAELKGSIDKREKALRQIESGCDFVRHYFSPREIVRKFVVYRPNEHYYFERV